MGKHQAIVLEVEQQRDEVKVLLSVPDLGWELCVYVPGQTAPSVGDTMTFETGDREEELYRGGRVRERTRSLSEGTKG